MGDAVPISKFPGGMAVLDKAVASTLAANTATSTTSDYTEATPRPGSAIPDDAFSSMRVEVSGAQTTDLDVRCVNAGNPGRETDGAQIAWKKNSEAAASWRGWDGPNVAHSWYAVAGNNINNVDRYDAKTKPKSQTVSVAYREPASTDAQYVTLSAAGTLTAAANSVADGTDWNHPALIVLPESERVLMFYGGTAYYTDDDAATAWNVWSSRIVTVATSTFQETRVALYRGSIIMLVEDTVVNKVTQLASSDMGASFRLVKEYLGFGSKVSVASTGDALFVCYIDTSNDVQVRALQSAWEELDAQDPVQAVASCDEASIVADPGGTLYVFHETTGVSNVEVVSSDDLGLTWTGTYRGTPYNADNAPGPQIERPILAWGAGWCHMLGYIDGASDNTLGLWRCCGWTNAPIIAQDTTTARLSDRYGYEDTWIPADLPTLFAYTLTGTAITLASGEGRWNLAAAAGNYTASLGINTCAVVNFEMRVASGGSLSSLDSGIRLRVANGTFDYELTMAFAATGYRFIDINGPVTTDISTSMTAYQEFLVYIDEGEARVWRRTRGDTVWTLDIDTTVTNDAATPQASGVFTWGTIATATVDHYWRHVQYQGGADTIDVSQSVSEHYGRPMNARPFPIPEIGTSSLAAALALVSGPCRKDDGVSVPAFYEHAIENVLCDLTPSKSRKWRSTDTSEQVIAFELGDTSLSDANQQDWHGYAMLLYVAGANFRQAILEAYNGSTWDTLGTLDLAADFIDVNFARLGQAIIPSSGTAGDRYLWENELAGGWVRLDNGGGTVKARTISANSSGGWISGSTTVVPNVTMSNIDGTEPGSGTARLHSPEGVLVVYNSVPNSYSSRVRVRIPAGTAGQDAPASYYEAGVIAVMRMAPFGDRIDWGSSMAQETSVRSSRDEYGTSRVRELGPPRRNWTFGWPNSVDLTDIRTNVDPDYIAISGGLGLTASQDVHQLLMGLVEVSKSGERPVVVVEGLPTTSGVTLTDPTRFLYGRVASSIRVDNVQGNRGEDEVDRVASVVVEGIE